MMAIRCTHVTGPARTSPDGSGGEGFVDGYLGAHPHRLGLSHSTVKHRLGLSHSTVKHHLANARCKVGAATTAQLVGILGPRLPEPEGLAKLDPLDEVVVLLGPGRGVRRRLGPAGRADTVGT